MPTSSRLCVIGNRRAEIDSAPTGQLSTVNCQLSTVNCQLSTVNCQLSTGWVKLAETVAGGQQPVKGGIHLIVGKQRRVLLFHRQCLQ